MKLEKYLFILALTLVITSCASVDVVKVPEGDKGDKVHGFRYYMPRPCVAVRKPFPVIGTDYFAYGTIQDGNVVSIDLTQQPLKSHLDELGLPSGSGTATLAIGGPGDDIETQAQSASTDTMTKTGTGTGGAPLSSATGTLGDSSASPVFKVNDYFDIVEMPDFNEMYAVRTDAGLGKASSSLSLSGGWMLSKADVNLDNSEMGKLVADSIGKVLDLGLSVAKGAFLPGSNLAGTPTTQSQPAPSTPAAMARNTVVLLRLRLYLEAQVGMYPFLKPDEVAPMRTELAAQEGDGNPPHFFIQYGFYTVGYNVRRVVDIEVVKAVSTTSNNSTDPNGVGAGGDAGISQTLPAADLTTLKSWWDANANSGSSGNITAAKYNSTTRELTVTLKAGSVPDIATAQTTVNTALSSANPPLAMQGGKSKVNHITLSAQ